MWRFKALEFLKWLIAFIFSTAVFFAVGFLNVTAFPFEGDKEYYLYSPSSQAQIKKSVNLLEVPFIRGESVTINHSSKELLEKVLADYDAKIVKVEKFDGGVSYYCYSCKLKDGIVLDGEFVNLQVAIKKESTVIGTPIIFGGY